MLLDAAQQAATPQGYSIGIALLLAVWAYVGIVLNLGPGLWWQEALVAGFVTGVVVGDIPLGLSVGGTLTLLSLGLWTYGGATIPVWGGKTSRGQNQRC
jgi:mannose PTS system EIIC component